VKRNSKAAEILHKVLCSERYGILLSENEMEDPSVNKLIYEARETFSADLIETAYIEGLPFSFKPILDLLNDPAKSVSEENNKFLTENVLSYLHELNIYLDSKCIHQCNHCRDAYKQCAFCTKFEFNVMTIDDYETLFISISHIGLNMLNIFTNSTDLEKLKETVEIANKYGLNPNLYVNYLNVNKDLLGKTDKIQINKINILFDAVFLDKWEYRELSAHWIFIVKDEEELEKVFDLINRRHLDAEVKPLYTEGNENFFKDNIFTSEQDIFEKPISKKEIFTRQKLNRNLFGKLSITPTGDVYANLNREPLVNIKHSNLREAIFKELKDGGSWMYTRDNKECKNCAYKYLCPSPGNYELYLKKDNLCNIVKD